MCGFITGLNYSYKGISLKLFRQSLSYLSHRGPDNSHIMSWDMSKDYAKSDIDEYSQCFLGFARLSIRDLSHDANQPMLYQHYGILFNGEIYNTEYLKSKFLRGYNFHTTSDTEVVLKLLVELGEEAIRHLNGMFAIVFYDFKNKNIIIARDRAGVKPLYYYHSFDKLLISSELKPIMNLIDKKCSLDGNGIKEFFAFNYTLGDTTLFSEIKSLEPGYIKTFNIDKKGVHSNEKKYWEMKFNPIKNCDYQDLLAETKRLINKAISRQLVSDVEVGSFLSGGIDSSIVSQIASNEISKLKTFTCGFDTKGMKGLDSYFDESEYAKKFAKIIGSDHYEIQITHEDMPLTLDEVCLYMEEPRVGVSYQIYQLAKMINGKTKVVLSGTGGDELFAGYHWKYSQIITKEHEDDFLDTYFEISNRIIKQSRFKKAFTDSFNRSCEKQPKDTFVDVVSNCNSSDPLDKAMFFDFKGFLRGLLHVEDRLNMSQSLECRVPFLDNDVIDLALQIPSQFKFDSVVSKKILKEAYSEDLGDEIVNRRKQGFTPPDATWFLKENKRFILDILMSDEFKDWKIFNPKFVENILEEHFNQKQNHRFLIWSWLCMHKMISSFDQKFGLNI